jgi:hypothetical protein
VNYSTDKSTEKAGERVPLASRLHHIDPLRKGIRTMRPYFLVSAAAAMLSAPLPALAQSSDWTGFYAGGRLGYTTQPEDNDEIVEFDTNLDGSFGDTVSW